MFLSHGAPVRIACVLLALAGFYQFYYGFAGHFCYNPVGHTASLLPTSSGTVLNRNSLFLDGKQCEVAFPLLFKEIDDAVNASGEFAFNRSTDGYAGQVHARIKDGKLYIISLGDQWSQDMVSERTSILNQIQRAITTSPTPLPDTIFTFSVLDTARKHAWSFARPSLPNTKGEHWLMPHFSYWSWPKTFIGTFSEALVNIERIERETLFEDKIAKAVWRGTVFFNSVMNLELRPKMMQVTKGKEWADVQALVWEKQGTSANNSIAIEEFCRYKYIIYTEGVTYSGRLPFHQACASIILTPPPNFLLHNTHLLRPLFTSTLPLTPSPKYHTLSHPSPRWPTSYPASSANIIFVDIEWADLEQTIEYLEANPELAKGIARRQRELFVGEGYASVSAEVCYWRRLIVGWGSVARVADEGVWRDKSGGIGMRWETFSLLGKLEV